MTTRSADEWAHMAAAFGVDIEQVRRDHLISHVLAAIADGVSTDEIVFFGGTALSRTFLTDVRLSEDIDLIALAPRGQVADQIEAIVRRGLARTHGRPTWRPALTSTVGSQPAVLSVPDGTSIQVQLLSGDGYSWPTAVTAIDQRYGDAPPARLRTLTAPAFAAAKLNAWIDRSAPRDLYDLWALAERGLIDAEAAHVFVSHGPFAKQPPAWVFDRELDEAVWRRSLSHQTRLSVTAVNALHRVRDAWAQVS